MSPTARSLCSFYSRFFVLAILGIGLGCGSPSTAPSTNPAAPEGEKPKEGTSSSAAPKANSSADGQLAADEAPATATEATTTVGTQSEEPTKDGDEESVESVEESAADEPQLGIGDAAPELAVSTWVKGESVTGFEPGQTYVVEFWATWCGPCKMSMPHISELQSTYGDKVKFIGVSDETEEVVREFLKAEQAEGKTWDDVITYTLAMDDDKATTNERYMRAAAQNGIPSAFVVGKDGHIEWIGHPMAIEKPLAEVVAGTWDRERAKAEIIAERKMMLRMKQLQEKMQLAAKNEDWESALKILDEMTEGMADGNPAIELTRSSFLRNAGRESEASAIVDGIREKNWDDPNTLNQLAWTLAAQMGGIELDLALKAALRADELSKGGDASIQDTVARVYYEMKQLDDAIAWQQKAVDNATGGDRNLKATLEQYQKEKANGDEETATATEETAEGSGEAGGDDAGDETAASTTEPASTP